MKKVGRQVLFLSTDENNLRNGEGTFIRLKNGDVMYAFTEYMGQTKKDHGNARICCCISKDEGESWSERRPLIEMDEGAQNIMSVSLLRLKSGKLGVIYLRKSADSEGGCICMPVFRVSDNEGESFSNFVYCTDKKGYYCPFNGSAKVLKSGRIVLPVAYVMDRYDIFKKGIKTNRPECGPYVEILYSDNEGETWHTMPHRFESPYADTNGLVEPGIYEQDDGSIFVWFRTVYGYQYQSVSKDGGKSWSKVEPNFFFTSPDSPMQVDRACKMTAAVFNPVPYYVGNQNREEWKSPKRTPLLITLDKNDGKVFSENKIRCANGGFLELENNTFVIEDDKNNSFCYPAIFDGGNYILVAYYHSNNTNWCLNCAKITKIDISEIV